MKNRILLALALIVVTAVAFGVIAGAYTITPSPDDVTSIIAPSQIRFDSLYEGSYTLANIPAELDSQNANAYFDNDNNLLINDESDVYVIDDVVHYSRVLVSEYMRELVGASFIFEGIDPYFLRTSSVYRANSIEFACTGLVNGRASLDVWYSYYDSDGYLREGYVYKEYLGIYEDFSFNIRDELFNLFESNDVYFGAKGFYIDTLALQFDSPNGTFSPEVSYITYAGGELGVAISPRYLPDIRTRYVDPDIFGWLSSSVQGFLDTPIYGENITFGSLLIILISVPLTIAFLKFFAGG